MRKRENRVIIWILKEQLWKDTDSSSPSQRTIVLSFFFLSIPISLTFLLRKNLNSLSSFQLKNGWICWCIGIGSMAAKSVYSGWASEFEISRMVSLTILFHYQILYVRNHFRLHFHLLCSSTQWRERRDVWRLPTCLHKWRNWNKSEKILQSKKESRLSEIPINVWMKTLISRYFLGYAAAHVDGNLNFFFSFQSLNYLK